MEMGGASAGRDAYPEGLLGHTGGGRGLIEPQTMCAPIRFWLFVK